MSGCANSSIYATLKTIVLAQMINKTLIFCHKCINYFPNYNIYSPQSYLLNRLKSNLP